MNKHPEIFLSYSHKNKDVAESIDKDFQSIGITFRRDVRDVGYMESFKTYMERIRDSGYALMIISDEYLKSENCMYEVLEFLKEKDIQDRILLIILENAKIFDTFGKAEYLEHWNNKFEEINNKTKDFPREEIIPLIEDLKKVKDIKSNIAEFLKLISDKKSIPLSALKENNYRAILDKIGFTQVELYEELLKIQNIQNIEEREIVLENFINNNPTFPEGYFYRAYLTFEKREYIKAKHYYEEVLRINPDYALAHFNLAILLANKFEDKEGAKKHYEESLRVNPNYAEAHNNLAILLAKRFDDKENAKEHYEESLRINPDDAEAHYNLSILLANKFDDKQNAKEHYEESLRINPDDTEAHINLAILLAYKFDDKEGAKKHYEESLRINPDDAAAHYNLSILLAYKFDDKKRSKEHYLKAIAISPDLRNEEDDKYFEI